MCCIIQLSEQNSKNMKILHLTPESNGYENVELIANRFDEHNQMAVIQQENASDLSITGGFLICDTPEIRAILDKVKKEDQYKFIKMLREIPYAKLYYNEPKKEEPKVEIKKNNSWKLKGFFQKW